MDRWLFFLVLSAALTAARAEIAIEPPIADTPTNRPVPGINVPAPRPAAEETNAVVAAAPVAKPAAPRATAAQPWQRLDAPTAGNDSLTFTNGDQFVGAFLGIEDGVIRWQPTRLKAPVRLRAAGLDEVTLGVGLQTILPPPVRWLVVLTDGSLLPARHLTFEDGTVAADFAYAGAVRLDRGHVAALRRCDETAGGLVTLGDAPLYAPPAKPKDANADRLRMRYREAKLPDPFLLEFPWDGRSAQSVSLRLFAGKGEDLGRAAPAFYFDWGFDSGQVRWTADASGRWETQPLSGRLTNLAGRVVWVGFALNRRSGDAALYLDGQLHSRAVLTGLIALPDFGVAVAETPSWRLVPRSVLVSRLNDDLALPAPPADRDAVRLINGDQIVGRLETVGTNDLTFQATVGRIVLPLDRVAQVAFPSVTNAPMRAGEVRVGLCDGSNVRGVWQRADAETAVVRHAVLGPIAFPRNALAGVDGEAGSATDREFSPRVLADALLTGAQVIVRPGMAGAPHWTVLVGGRFVLPTLGYQPGLIEFHDGTSWQGDLVGITNGVVQWRHPAALDPLAIPRGEARRVLLLPRPLPALPATELATLRLGNGDILSGTLGAGGGETVAVTPRYAGPLAVPRRHVALVTPYPAAADALEMPLAAAAPGQPAPSPADGAVWLGAVRRPGPLPDRVRLDFEAVWPDRAGMMRVSLFQRDDPPDPTREPERLSAVFQPNGTTLGVRTPEKVVSTNFPPIAVMTNLLAGGCVHVTVFADRTNRYLRLLLDGQTAGEWRGRDVPAPAGDALVLTAGGRLGAAVRHIVLREWREDSPAPPAVRSNPMPPRAPGDARVILQNGDLLMLTDIASDERTVTGKHALLGPLTLDRAGVRALDWNRPVPSAPAPVAKR
jgi:hypothetical protein